MTNEIEILKALKILGDVYSNSRLSSSSVEVYVQLLADIPAEVLEQAAIEHISRSTYFPTIAELRAAAFDILEAVDPIPTDYEAWAEVQAEIRRVGNAGQPQFSHALVARAVQLFGWRYLCLSENPVADRSHFIQAYQALRENARRESRRAQRVTEFILALKCPAGRLLPEGQAVRE
ncbi:MAG: hypothetical protein ACOYYS_08785 [Chloroflexota bacterium]